MIHKPIFTLKRAIIVLMAPFVFLACEKPNEGLGFDQIIGAVPDADVIEFGAITATRNQDSLLVAINYDGQRLLVNGYGSIKLIGTYVDPLFGQAKAEFVSEMILEDLNPSFGTTPIVDSVNLYLRTVGSYGDTLSPMSWSVHTLAENLSRDSTFYSSFEPVTGTQLGELSNFTPRPGTPVAFEGEAVPSSIKIPLDPSFFQQTFADQGDGFSAFATNEDFRTYFPGIKVSVQEGSGSILSISPASVYSRLLIFYRLADTSTTTESVELNFSQNKTTVPIGFSTFEQDYSTYPVAFDTANADSEVAYVQSMGGVFTTLSFEGLDTLLDQNFVINRAFIEVPIERTTTGGYPAHSSLEIRQVENDVPGSLTLDFSSGAGGGGLLRGDLRDNRYRFEFTRELFVTLNALDNTAKIPTFAIVPVNKSTVSNRTVLKGGKSLLETPKLIVYYTKP